MILATAQRQHEEDCLRRKCTIELYVHRRYRFQVDVWPIGRTLVVAYKFLEFRAKTKSELEEVVCFLAGEITDAVMQLVHKDMRHNGYSPRHDAHFNDMAISVSTKSGVVFDNILKNAAVREALRRYVLPMWYRID